MPWTTPKTDWDTNPTNPIPSDFNRIEGNIEFLNSDIETKKGLIVDALNSVGIAALIADTHVQLANKITGAEKTGISITPGTANQEIPKGIYDTGGGIILGDPDLISANIKAGANIFGVAGNSNVVDTSGGDATAAQILSGKKAYVDGALVTGTITTKGAATITPGTANQTIAAGQYLSGIQTIAGDTDLVAGNIKSGANVFGVVGSYLGDSIKSIQKVVISTYTEGFDFGSKTIKVKAAINTTTNFTIAAVNTAYTVIVGLSYKLDTCLMKVNLVNSTTASVYTTASNLNYTRGEFLIIEFDSAHVNRFITGSASAFTVGAPSTSVAILTIPAVNIDKTFIFMNGGQAGSSEIALLPSANLYSSTLVQFFCLGGSGTVGVDTLTIPNNYYIVELK